MYVFGGGGMTVKSQYKQLVRRVRRLPVDSCTLRGAVGVVKTNFALENGSRGRYNRTIRLLDEILVEWKFTKVPEVLDICYTKWNEKWAVEFLRLSFQSLKPYWPQYHLIHAIDDSAALKKYNRMLEKEKNDDFSVSKHFGFDPDTVESIPLVRAYASAQKSKLFLVSKLTEYHKLLNNNPHICPDKLPMLEVAYPTNRFASPVHPKIRDNLLRSKVVFFKTLLQKYKPIEKLDLVHLYKVAIHKPSLPSDLDINPGFFRYMNRIKPQYNPVLKKIRPKHLIPTDNNIRKIYRSYVMSLFYIEDGQFKPSWMDNFYENENPIPLVQDLLKYSKPNNEEPKSDLKES